jgi:hypothetical protein
MTGVFLLALGMGEQLDRLDVGVAVDDAPGQGRARLGHVLALPGDARNEPCGDGDKPGEPQPQRDQQPAIGFGQDRRRADEEDRGIPDLGCDLVHRIVQCRGKLDLLVGDPAGEVVGEEAQGLAQHLAMRPPADQRAHLGVEALVRDEGFQDTHHRAQQEHNRSHCQEGGPVIGPDGRGLGHCQQIYQLPGKARQRRLGQREDQRQQH